MAWERLLEAGDPRAACKTMVGLLALAHERNCEASSQPSWPRDSIKAACVVAPE